MRTVAIIQARLGSQRLPEKVLADIAGHALLWHVVNRTRKAKTLDDVVVATSFSTADRRLVEWCQLNSIPIYRGGSSEDDLLGRYHDAAIDTQADIIVRITGDCPMIDPATIDAVVELLLTENAEYASNIIPLDCSQDGTDVEAFTMSLLGRAHVEATEVADREHCTLWMRRYSENQALYTGGPRDLLSVDTLEDLKAVRKMMETERV